MSFYAVLFKALFVTVTVSVPILVVLTIIRAVRGVRSDRDVLKEVKSLLDEIRETQEKTNRLPRRYVTGERSDTG